MFYVCQLEYVSCLSSQSIIYRCSFSYYSETYILTKSNCTATTTLHCRKLWKECEYSTSCIIAFIVWLLLQSWTKMLRKMHVLCLILEHFPLKPGLLKILPPPPQKNKVEVWPEHFCSWLNNIDQWGVGGGVTIVPNSRGGSPVSNTVQNSWHFLSMIVALIILKCFLNFCAPQVSLFVLL